MPGITSFPCVVRDAVEQFGDLFVCEPERRHFAEYLTGLMVAARETVRGINADFAMTTDRSCLNRFLTELKWEEAELNERRMAWVQNVLVQRDVEFGVAGVSELSLD